MEKEEWIVDNARHNECILGTNYCFEQLSDLLSVELKGSCYDFVFR